jgi:multicomponent Na+:H+ antiporter subunit G
MSHVVAVVLLAIAGVVTLASTVGFLRARDSLVRFHYLTPISTVATFAVALAMIFDGASPSTSVKAMLVFLITALTSPVTQHAVARAIWTRRAGAWTLPDEEAR